MKILFKLFSIFVGSIIFSMASIAENANPPQQNPPCMSMGGMHKSMMGNMTGEQKEKHLRARQEHMLKMHKLSDKILATDDLKEEEQLKQQQLDLMKEKMAKKKARMAKMMENCNSKIERPGQMIQMQRQK